MNNYKVYYGCNANGDTTSKLEDDIRERVETAKNKIKGVFCTALAWSLDHPEEAAAIAGAAVFGIRKIDKCLDIRRADKLRNSMIYDRSLGMYWETRRPLTANQRLTIESRHKAGEPYGKILSDMKLLKR